MIKIYFDVLTEPIPKLYETLMKRVIRKTVSEEYPNHKFEVNVTICDDDEIQVINKEHRGIDKPTGFRCLCGSNRVSGACFEGESHSEQNPYRGKLEFGQHR